MAGGGSGTFTSSKSPEIYIVGTSVQVDVRGTGDFAAFEAALTGLGMQISATDAGIETVEGLLPIGELLNVSQLSQTVSISPVYKPMLN